jgi:hypothetical protein
MARGESSRVRVICRRMKRRRARPKRPTTRKPTPASEHDRARWDTAEPPNTVENHALAAYYALFPPDRAPRWTGTQRPPISYYLGVFDDPAFWRDTYAFVGAVGDVTEQALSDRSFQNTWKEILKPFWYHYRAMPAVEFLSVYYRQGFCVMSGRWGVVPVYPWTKDDELKAAIHSIRKKIGQTRGDTEKQKHAALGVWLKLHGFKATEVAAALGASRAGQGQRPLDETTRRPIEGSEPPIDAWLRVTRGRVRRAHAGLQAALQSPSSIDPLTDAITNVLRLGVFPGPANLEDLAAAVARLHDLLGIRPLL